MFANIAVVDAAVDEFVATMVTPMKLSILGTAAANVYHIQRYPIARLHGAQLCLRIIFRVGQLDRVSFDTLCRYIFNDTENSKLGWGQVISVQSNP